MALSLAFAAELAGKDRAGRVMGMLGAMSAAGTALGPSLGGLLLEAYGWRALFLALLPPGAAGLAWRYLPAGGAPANRPRFDGPGTVLLAATLLAYALAMTLGRGHAGWFNLALLCLAGAGAWLFLWTEARVAAPLIQPALLRESALRLGCAANALVSTVMMATLVVGPFYLAGALGLDAGGTGLAMSAGPVAAALAGMPAGRLADRHGAGRMALLGLAAMAAGCALLALAPAALGVVGYIAPLLVLTAGYALFQAANGAAVMAAAPAGHRGVVSGLLTLSRNLDWSPAHRRWERCSPGARAHRICWRRRCRRWPPACARPSWRARARPWRPCCCRGLAPRLRRSQARARSAFLSTLLALVQQRVQDLDHRRHLVARQVGLACASSAASSALAPGRSTTKARMTSPR